MRYGRENTQNDGTNYDQRTSGIWDLILKKLKRLDLRAAAHEHRPVPSRPIQTADSKEQGTVQCGDHSPVIGRAGRRREVTHQCSKVEGLLAGRRRHITDKC